LITFIHFYSFECHNTGEALFVELSSSFGTVTFEPDSKLSRVDEDPFENYPSRSSICIPSSLQNILLEYRYGPLLKLNQPSPFLVTPTDAATDQAGVTALDLKTNEETTPFFSVSHVPG
jgi:hypothetical protein